MTVLVPAHNEAATIGRCIAAVQASTYPVDRIIVVADACTDRTAELAKAAGAEVVLTWERDKAAAQNRVLPTIDSDVVVGFDGDTFPAPDCVALLLAKLDAGWDAVGATVLPAQPRGFFIRSRRFAYALGRRWWRWTQSQVGRVQVLTGACYAFRTAAIRAVGGFPSVGISADMDVTWALHRAGYRLAYVGAAVAYTLDPETFAAYRTQMRRWAAGYFQTMSKHRRGLWHPKAVLVVWTALLDLLLLPVSYAMVGWWAWQDPTRIRWYWAYLAGHLVVNTVLVATVVGWREALLGVVPYTLVNVYNKALYLWTFFREWVLGRHYQKAPGHAWAGRAGPAAQISSMTPRRKLGLATAGAIAGIALALWVGPTPPPGTAPAGPPAAALGRAGPNRVLDPPSAGGGGGPSTPRPRPDPPAGTATAEGGQEAWAADPVALVVTVTFPPADGASPTTTPRTTAPDTTAPATTGTTAPATTATTLGSTTTWPSTPAPTSDPSATSTAAPAPS